jgi:hypothetical protein
MHKLEIESINFSSLHSEAHYEFFWVLFKLFEKYPPVRDLIRQFWDDYLNFLELENQLFDAPKTNPITKKLAALDRRIDNDLRGIKAIIRGDLHHFDPATAEAAQVLYDRIKDFGNIKKKAYEEESAAVQVLVRDFQGVYISQVNLLNINKWVDDLVIAESSFTQLLEERNAELAMHPPMNIREVRFSIESIYRNMIRCINTDLLVNGEGTCGEFAKELNGEINYFIEHSHHRVRIYISETMVAPIPDQVFTGKQIVFLPDVFYKEAKDKPEVELVFATDYTLAFKDNINPGNATLMIRGKGKYKGQKIVTFTIVK